jgi:hypothetical protein
VSAPPIRVLLLEDDPDDAVLVRRMLRRVKAMPFEVVVVNRLARAVAILTADPAVFDVVLADLGLPDSTGIATLDALTEVAPHLPVVVLTGNDDDAQALDALKRGAQDYVVKGIGDAFTLSRVVRYAIERKLGEEVLREARDKAEQATRAKSVFLAMMGHEIRTPLNGVLGMARLLTETPLDQMQTMCVETLVSSGELLLGLVNDILDLARLDADGLILAPEPFDLAESVEEVRRLLAPRAAEKGLSFTVSLAPGLDTWVDGDRLRLRQILLNLVGNAIKFTDRGGVGIAVVPVQLPGQPQHLRFAVVDTGIGLYPEAHDKLFSEFWQGDSGTDRRFSGAGLGLAICKRLATLMGGVIGCDSRLGSGSTFRVDLPLPAAASPLERGDAPAASPPAPGTRRVLLVDDNEVNRVVAAGLLERRGHAVVVAGDGFAAVEAARAGGFDLVLLDLRMPGMDGLEAARAIRALPGAAGRVPVYLLTANPQGADERGWREAGIAGCLGKPVRVEDLDRVLADPKLVAAVPPLVSLSGLIDDRRELGAARLAGLAGLFRRSSAADLADLLAHAAAGDALEVARLAHRMAGAAASLHLPRLAAACLALEAEANLPGGDLAGAAGTVEPTWRRSLAALDGVLARA